MLYSTDDIWRGSEEERCLTDDLNAIESDIADLDTDKADADHTHDGYASSNHEHTGYASSDHAHADYATISHEHTGYAAANHSHDYAAGTHTHAQSQISGLEAALAAKAPNSALAAKADLVDGKVPDYQLPSYVDDVIEGTLSNGITFRDALGVILPPETDKIYVDTTTNKSYRWSGSMFVQLNGGIALGETSATAYRGDRGKTAYDHSQNGDVHVTTDQKAAWDSKADSNHTHDYAAPEHSHTPASIGAAAASHTHSGYAAASHTHSYAEESHKHTEHSGDITIVKAKGPGINLDSTSLGVKTRIHKNAADTTDYGTIISDYAADGKRDYLTIRRSSPSMGNKLLLSVEDENGGATKIYQIYGEHNKPGILWYGALYMSANQTITPSKPLSECRTGWMLVWSDYDPDTKTVIDGEFFSTMIPRMAPTGVNWAGKTWLCDIPRTTGSDNSIVTLEKRILKTLYVHDDKLVGHASNNQDTRTDVVLRAVYEF